MENKSLQLTLGERYAAAQVLQGFRGDMLTMSHVLEDIRSIAITQEEWDAAKLVRTPIKEGNEKWEWTEPEVQKDCPISQPTAKYLVDAVQQKSDAGELTLADMAAVALLKKMKELYSL